VVLGIVLTAQFLLALFTQPEVKLALIRVEARGKSHQGRAQQPSQEGRDQNPDYVFASALDQLCFRWLAEGSC
jgi:hypothetical protein